MKMNNAMNIIDNYNKEKGYRVHFDRIDGAVLKSDYFPDSNEPLIALESQAAWLAKRFADATIGICINIYVINEKYEPVGDHC